jgi:hypothetical protein
MPLPTEKTQTVIDPAKMSILLYGPGKIGKSTFVSEAENALFISTQDSLKHLSVYPRKVNSWMELLEAYEEVKDGKHKFSPITIDMLDDAYNFCMEHFCKKHNVEHPSDLGYGKGWDAVNRPFKILLNRFALLGRGLILQCHAKEKEIKTRTGDKTRTVPTLGGSIADAVMGWVDLILYCTIDVSKNDQGNTVQTRVLRTSQNADYEAGGRFKGLPDPLPMNYKLFMETAHKAAKERKGK